MTSNIKSKQLELLLNDFELLSKTAMIQMQIAHKLLHDNKIVSLYEEAESNEIIMDRLEIKVREEVVFTIFQFNPIAADLRKIITYQDVTTNLERVGDMLLNIIHFLRETNLAAPEFENICKKIDKMMQYAGEMLRNAIFSFSNEDSHTAYQVIEDDDKVDRLFHEIALSLQDAFTGKPLSKAEVQSIINANAISYNLERIGDSATNIAEAAIYLTEGKDIRHGNKK
ncbi:phosphate transport system protein [Dysgonomonas hofstadii]|uniref:Phosphate transport system protein n=1 Tax=Dysgonomonas hofstadii TaxID=637886 RepID=A0A840CZR7_9BACT|nr:PhoU domain-containing protein [Dysgonomonas hofstadii]MBB4037493.1 phosphate transport system protein [Dysgonomonas hofstadii]